MLAVGGAGFGWLDAVVIAAMVIAEPFVEWLMHVAVLHFRPRRIRGRSLDLHVAREHRRHHEDPKNVPLIFIPHRTLAQAIVAITAAAFLLSSSPGIAATIVVFAAFEMLLYEWTHYLIHTAYRPRGRHFASIARAHRLHHYRNERYWLGVTSNAADRVLHTFPERSQVAASPTARDLLASGDDDGSRAIGTMAGGPFASAVAPQRR